jgi:hypothetical protein
MAEITSYSSLDGMLISANILGLSLIGKENFLREYEYGILKPVRTIEVLGILVSNYCNSVSQYWLRHMFGENALVV